MKMLIMVSVIASAFSAQAANVSVSLTMKGKTSSYFELTDANTAIEKESSLKNKISGRISARGHGSKSVSQTDEQSVPATTELHEITATSLRIVDTTNGINMIVPVKTKGNVMTIKGRDMERAVKSKMNAIVEEATSDLNGVSIDFDYSISDMTCVRNTEKTLVCDGGFKISLSAHD